MKFKNEGHKKIFTEQIKKDYLKATRIILLYMGNAPHPKPIPVLRLAMPISLCVLNYILIGFWHRSRVFSYLI